MAALHTCSSRDVGSDLLCILGVGGSITKNLVLPCSGMLFLAERTLRRPHSSRCCPEYEGPDLPATRIQNNMYSEDKWI